MIVFDSLTDEQQNIVKKCSIKYGINLDALIDLLNLVMEGLAWEKFKKDLVIRKSEDV